MNHLILVSIRNFFVENFFVKIHGVYSNKKFYSNDWLLTLFFILRIIPFSIIRNLFSMFNCQIIYEIDCIHNITNTTNATKKHHILPIISKFELVNTSSNKSICIKSKLKNYNSSLPVRYVIQTNKCDEFNQINIKCLKKGKFEEKSHLINEVIDNKLINLFND
jgi:hypothetical protein